MSSFPSSLSANLGTRVSHKESVSSDETQKIGEKKQILQKRWSDDPGRSSPVGKSVHC